MKQAALLLLAILLTLGLLGCQQTADPAVTTTPVTTAPPATTAAPLPVGWVEMGGNTYYYSADHVMVTGWQEIDGAKYYFASNGAMATGWQMLDGHTYYLTEEGLAAPGWQEIDARQYYFTEEGTPITGWQTVDELERYFTADGALATGKVDVEGTTRWFASNGTEIILVNPWNFIPEYYNPEIVTIRDSWWKTSTECHEALLEMLQGCRDAGLNPEIVSAYRTHGDQNWLYNNKINRLMNEGYSREEATRLAGTVVAVPGTSEHELGLAFDLVDKSYQNLDEAQEATPVQQWLMVNSWRYGFILRYPNSKSESTGIIYEPWHYRYVGIDIATEIYDSGLCLEEYLEMLTQE